MADEDARDCEMEPVDAIGSVEESNGELDEKDSVVLEIWDELASVEISAEVED